MRTLRDLGAQRFFTKPPDFAALGEALGALIDLAGARRRTASPSTAAEALRV